MSTSQTIGKVDSSVTGDWNWPVISEKGWECPRCGKIWAPWVSHCSCNNNWSVTWTSDHVNIKPDDWKKYVTCEDDNVLNNPNTYKYTTSSVNREWRW